MEKTKQDSPMDVPERWEEITEELHDNQEENLSYEHTNRELRAHIVDLGNKYQSFIVNSEGEYEVHPEEWEEYEQAVDRLRMHMEYY